MHWHHQLLLFSRLALHDNSFYICHNVQHNPWPCVLFFKQRKHNPSYWILSFRSVTLSLASSQQRSVTWWMPQNAHGCSELKKSSSGDKRWYIPMMDILFRNSSNQARSLSRSSPSRAHSKGCLVGGEIGWGGQSDTILHSIDANSI